MVKSFASENTSPHPIQQKFKCDLETFTEFNLINSELKIYIQKILKIMKPNTLNKLNKVNEIHSNNKGLLHKKGTPKGAYIQLR